MASGTITENNIQKIVLEKVSFTFDRTYHTIWNCGTTLQNRSIGLYISYIGDNSGAISVCFSSGVIYALGDIGTVITNLEVTLVYI